MRYAILCSFLIFNVLSCKTVSDKKRPSTAQSSNAVKREGLLLAAAPVAGPVLTVPLIKVEEIHDGKLAFLKVTTIKDLRADYVRLWACEYNTSNCKPKSDNAMESASGIFFLFEIPAAKLTFKAQACVTPKNGVPPENCGDIQSENFVSTVSQLNTEENLKFLRDVKEQEAKIQDSCAQIHEGLKSYLASNSPESQVSDLAKNQLNLTDPILCKEFMASENFTSLEASMTGSDERSTNVAIGLSLGALSILTLAVTTTYGYSRLNDAIANRDNAEKLIKDANANRDDLAKTISEQESEIKKLENQLEETKKASKDLQSSLENIDEQKNTLERELTAKQGDKTANDTEIEKIKSLITDMTANGEARKQDIQNAENEVKAVEDSIKTSKKKLDDLELTYDKLKTKIEKYRTERDLENLAKEPSTEDKASTLADLNGKLEKAKADLEASEKTTNEAKDNLEKEISKQIKNGTKISNLKENYKELANQMYKGIALKTVLDDYKDTLKSAGTLEQFLEKTPQEQIGIYNKPVIGTVAAMQADYDTTRLWFNSSTEKTARYNAIEEHLKESKRILDDFKKLETESKTIAESNTTLEASIKQYEEKIKNSERQTEEINKEIEKLNLEINKLDPEKLTESQKDTLAKAKAERTDRIATLNSKISKLQNKSDDLDAKRFTLNEQVLEKSEELKKSQKTMEEIKSKPSNTEDLKTQEKILSELAAKSKTLQNEISRLETEIKNNQTEKNKIEQSLSEEKAKSTPILVEVEKKLRKKTSKLDISNGTHKINIEEETKAQGQKAKSGSKIPRIQTAIHAGFGASLVIGTSALIAAIGPQLGLAGSAQSELETVLDKAIRDIRKSRLAIEKDWTQVKP